MAKTVAKIKASKDKETANAYRYKLQDNEHGLFGSLYVPKSNYEDGNNPETLRIKVLLSKD